MVDLTKKTPPMLEENFDSQILDLQRKIKYTLWQIKERINTVFDIYGNLLNILPIIPNRRILVWNELVDNIILTMQNSGMSLDESSVRSMFDSLFQDFFIPSFDSQLMAVLRDESLEPEYKVNRLNEIVNQVEPILEFVKNNEKTIREIEQVFYANLDFDKLLQQIQDKLYPQT